MTGQFTGIQLLRFTAAMLVVATHITQAISIHITGRGSGHLWEPGNAGVDIFFVISGFVMTVSTRSRLREGAAPRTEAWTDAWVFMKRRLLRIVPLYWFYTLLKVAVLLLMPALALQSSITGAHLAASLLFIPAFNSQATLFPVLSVGWTLNFEMLFYVIFACAIALRLPRIRFCLLALLVVFAVGHAVPGSSPLSFYARTMVFEFILGICIARAAMRYRTPSPPVGALAMLAGALYIFAIDWSPEADTLTSWGLGAAAMVMGAVWLEPWFSRSRTASRMSVLGDASYSIYLSHALVVPAATMALRRLGIQDAAAIGLALAIAVVAAGCASYLWLEKPMTTRLKRVFLKAHRLDCPMTGSPHAN